MKTDGKKRKLHVLAYDLHVYSISPHKCREVSAPLQSLRPYTPQKSRTDGETREIPARIHLKKRIQHCPLLPNAIGVGSLSLILSEGAPEGARRKKKKKCAAVMRLRMNRLWKLLVAPSACSRSKRSHCSTFGYDTPGGYALSCWT